MSGANRQRGQGAWRIFRWPLAIGLASGVGLVAALVGDGPYDVLSWLLLAGTLVVVAEAWRRAERPCDAKRGASRPSRPD